MRSGDGALAETIKDMFTGMQSIGAGPLMDERVFEERKAIVATGACWI